MYSIKLKNINLYWRREVQSYRRVAQNLVAIADMSLGHRKVSELIRKVARGDADLIVREPPDVGLIVFGFDNAQRDLVWKPLRDSLERKIGHGRVKAQGKTKGWKILVSLVDDVSEIRG